MTTNPVVSPVQGEAVDVEPVTAEVVTEPWDEWLYAALQPRLDQSDAAWVVAVIERSGIRSPRPVAVPTAREGETRTVEYSIVRDVDGHRYGGYNEECRAPGCDCYLARLPEPIIGDEHVEQREVYRTPWRRVGASS